jgi:hypothetical protein
MEDGQKGSLLNDFDIGPKLKPCLPLEEDVNINVVIVIDE